MEKKLRQELKKKSEGKSVEKEITKTHKWNTADTITSLRMAASFLLLFYPIHSGGFLTVYTVTGLTDVMDGWLARKKGMASEFGAKLDSMADLLFYSVVLLRLLPVLWQMLPMTLWYAAAAVVFVRLMSYVVAGIKYHRFASLHTWLNKLTGVGVFLLPYALVVTDGVTYTWAVCVLAFVSSVEELMIHIYRQEYRADRKSIFKA